jgi:hypothetical protein
LLFGPEASQPPFVGRRSQMQILEQAAFRENGRSRVLVLSGDSGDGVTRFIEEAHGKCRADFPGNKLKSSAVMTIDGGHLGSRDPLDFIIDLRNAFVASSLANSRVKPVDFDLIIFDDLARTTALLFNLTKPKLERSPSARKAGKGVTALTRLGTAGLWDGAQTLVQLSNLAQTGAEEFADAATKKERSKLAKKVTNVLARLGKGPASDFVRELIKGSGPQSLNDYLRALSAELLSRIAAFGQPGTPVLLYLLVDAFDLIDAEAHYLSGDYGVHDLVQQALDDVITAHGLAIIGGRSTIDLLTGRLTIASSEHVTLGAIRWADIEGRLGDEKCSALRKEGNVALVAGPAEVAPRTFAELWRKHSKTVTGAAVT